MAGVHYQNRRATGHGRTGPGAASKANRIGPRLKKLYGEALSENIPDNMRELLRALDREERTKAGPNGKTIK